MCIVKPIRTEAECAAALQRMYALSDAEPGAPEEEELVLLGELVTLYEYRNEALYAYEGRPLIKFWIKEKGWTVERINELLAGRGDIAAVAAGEQQMTPAMAEILRRQLRIPAAAWLRAANAPAPPANARIPG